MSKIYEELENDDGTVTRYKRHLNGRGRIAATATVDATAWIDPSAYVEDGATVQARRAHRRGQLG